MKKRFGWILFGGLSVAASVLVHPFGPVKMQQSSTPLAASVLDAQAAMTIERACRNCHSEKTEWPWYSYLPPLSWMIENDVQRGRSHMNFSRWNRYSVEEQQQHLAKMSIMVKHRLMPPPRYLLLHPEARLSDADITYLSQWARSAGRRIIDSGNTESGSR